MEDYSDEGFSAPFFLVMTEFQDDKEENNAMDPQNECCEDDQHDEEARIPNEDNGDKNDVIAPSSTPLIMATNILFTATKIGLPVPIENVLNFRGIEVFQALVHGKLTFRALRRHNRTHPKDLGVTGHSRFEASLRYMAKLLQTAETPTWIAKHILQLIVDCKDDTTSLEREDVNKFLIALRHVVWDVWGQLHVHDPYFHPRVDDGIQDMLITATHATRTELASFLETWRSNSWKVHLERIAREAGFLPAPPANQLSGKENDNSTICARETEDPQSRSRSSLPQKFGRSPGLDVSVTPRAKRQCMAAPSR